MFKSKNILITGGTGSYGKAFINRLIEHYPETNKIIILDDFMQYDNNMWNTEQII